MKNLNNEKLKTVKMGEHVKEIKQLKKNLESEQNISVRIGEHVTDIEKLKKDQENEKEKLLKMLRKFPI